MKSLPALLMFGVGIALGVYLILKPREYKDDLTRSGDDVLSRFPRWAIRILGVFLIVLSLSLSYLFLNSTK